MSTDVRTSAPATPRQGRGEWFYPLLARWHFYAGLLIAPFLLVAAITGGLYAIAPTVENVWYKDVVRVDPASSPLPLDDQVAAARRHVGADLAVSGVRPAPDADTATRVIFTDPTLGESQRRGVFVDPGSGRITGDLTVYGTSGALPMRMWIDLLHRQLHLGEAGRLYSELAASWLWLVALGGAALGIRRYRRTGTGPVGRSASMRPAPRGSRSLLVNRHVTIGLVALIGFLTISATGITWSRYGGDRITTLRQQLGWQTPKLDTAMPQSSSTGHAGQADHAGHADHRPVVSVAPATVGGAATHPIGSPTERGYDGVLAAARAAGIDSRELEIKPAATPDQAWSVTEVQRSWPAATDAVAVDPATGAITARNEFDTWPLAGKLTQWGIAVHMGLLFGLGNQLVLLAIAVALVASIVLGYRMWWRRRPTRVTGSGPLGVPLGGRGGAPPRAFAAAPLAARILLGIGLVIIGWFLPVLAVSLAVLALVDLVLTRRSRHLV